MSVPIYDDYYHKYRAAYKKTSTEGIANTKCILSQLMRRGWHFGAVCGLLGNAQAESALNPNRPEESKYNGYPDADWYPSNYAHGSKRGRYGFGLLQWTPWKEAYNDSKNYQTNGDGFGHPTFGWWMINKGYGQPRADDSNPHGNLIRQCEYIDTQPWGYYVYTRWKSGGLWENIKWSEFKALDDPERAGRAFVLNYERPGSISGKDATLSTATKICNTRASNARWYYNQYKDEFLGATPETPTEPDPPPKPPTPSEPEQPAVPGREKMTNFLILAKGAGII